MGCGGSRRQYAQQNGGGGSERGAYSRGQLGDSVGAPSKVGGGTLQMKQGTRNLPSAPARC